MSVQLISLIVSSVVKLIALMSCHRHADVRSCLGSSRRPRMFLFYRPAVLAKLDQITANQEKMMSALTDLQAAVASLSTAVTTASNAIATEAAAISEANANEDDAGVEAAVTNIN